MTKPSFLTGYFDYKNGSVLPHSHFYVGVDEILFTKIHSNRIWVP